MILQAKKNICESFLKFSSRPLAVNNPDSKEFGPADWKENKNVHVCEGAADADWCVEVLEQRVEQEQELPLIPDTAEPYSAHITTWLCIKSIGTRLVHLKEESLLSLVPFSLNRASVLFLLNFSSPEAQTGGKL